MLYGVFSSFVITVGDQGLPGLPQAIAGSLVLGLFTALVLPLGWSELIGSLYKEKGPAAEVVVVQPNFDPYAEIAE